MIAHLHPSRWPFRRREKKKNENEQPDENEEIKKSAGSFLKFMRPTISSSAGIQARDVSSDTFSKYFRAV